MDKTDWRDTEVPGNSCPYCGHQLDMAANPDGKTPEPGDASVCISCAQVLLFTGPPSHLTLRKPTLHELRELEANPNVRRFQQAIRSINRKDLTNG